MLDTLEQNASILLPENEIGLVLMSTTTSRSQITYWYDNIGEWEEIAPNGRAKCISSWRMVGKKAVSGALGGAAACAAGSIFGPIGWKVWGACVLGGAAGGAVAEATDQCLRTWTSSSQAWTPNLRLNRNFIDYSRFTRGPSTALLLKKY